MARFHSKLSPARRLILLALATIALLILALPACKNNGGSGDGVTAATSVKMDELRRVILAQVGDHDRATVMLGIVGRAEFELGTLNEHYRKVSGEFAAKSADHSVGVGELYSVLRSWENLAAASRVRLMDLMLAMKPYATREEWASLSDAFITSVLRQSNRDLGLS